ncbi:hypothetical protein L21SP3_00902 [Sedimentisphaera cyanobacteriorum]|uniref:Recombinase domain-containing protein n=1 Tax=Sedimentisphaera cyanobacteriorum TaxID=1940790 RepID=A0A1Q2HNS2_9BACT|nr:recombinase family protein [Sedimentisphaera cyanobacteriorum]AQQ09102.1 hypothetical protein L21SP3_00902 [Sedimentisphaera cyanobacteriorum]
MKHSRPFKPPSSDGWAKDEQKRPSGYKPDPEDSRRLAEDENEQLVIKNVIQQRKQGKGWSEIARWLNENGFPARDERWSHVAVIRIIDRYAPELRKIQNSIDKD